MGKTTVATLIAKKFFYSNGFPSYLSRCLIVCPPTLKDNSEDTFYKFGMNNYKVISSGSLHKLKNHRSYDLVTVDEAHAFRTDNSDRYFKLQNICKAPTNKRLLSGIYADKKVILVSATPLNNKPQDIANLIYLFQDAKNSTLQTSNLQNFFRKKTEDYKKLKDEKDLYKIKEKVKVKEIYKVIRINTIEPLTVRRAAFRVLMLPLWVNSILPR